MKKILILVLTIISTYGYTQTRTEQDLEIFNLINKIRIENGKDTITWYNCNYKVAKEISESISNSKKSGNKVELSDDYASIKVSKNCGYKQVVDCYIVCDDDEREDIMKKSYNFSSILLDDKINYGSVSYGEITNSGGVIVFVGIKKHF